MTQTDGGGRRKRVGRRRGRGDGGCHQRPDGLWVASASLGFDAAGRRVRPVAYGRTKAEAQARLAEKAGRPRAAAAAKGMTVGGLLDLWLRETKGSTELGTWGPRETRCRLHIKPRIGHVPLADLSAADVMKFHGDMLADGLPSGTRSKSSETLVTALGFAVNPLKLIPHNPARDVPRPKHKAREMRALSPVEARRFIEAAEGTWFYPLFLFLIDSGVRTGEAYGLKWSDVDWDSGSVFIQRTLERVSTRGESSSGLKDAKTPGSRRRVFLTPPTLRALAAHRGAMSDRGFYAPDGLVFVNKLGRPANRSTVRSGWFLPLLRKAGLPAIRPHDCRHTSATLLLAAGVDTKLVAQRLGHSTPAITASVYVHVLPGMGEFVAGKMAGLLAGDCRQMSPVEKTAADGDGR